MKRINLVCIVEDEPIHAVITKKYVELSGLVDKIMVCSNGKEAYESLKALITSGNALPELILLDLNMPVWDGWQFLEEFIKIPVNQEIIIYILTSSDNEEDMRRAKMFNLQGNYLIKPISRDQLKDVLADL